MIRSPLTGSDNVTLIERVPSERLIARWQSCFSIDITDELPNVPEILKYRCAEHNS
jgi:hypothetical protein